MMMSGSWRISARTPSAKPSSIAGCTCIWLNAGSTISIGSSMVQTLTSGVASAFSVEYRVVVLPEPVGPVTSTMPFGLAVISFQRFWSSSEKPSSRKSRTSTSGSKMRITIFSPKAVGSVDRRSSTSACSSVRVLMRPSCGRRFSTTSMRPRILMRLVIAARTAAGIWYTWCSTPSMRKRTMPCSRRGSMWMSLARCSKAYCHSQSTMRTMCASLASNCLSLLPSSTSCSKLESPLAALAVRLAPLIDLARL